MNVLEQQLTRLADSLLVVMERRLQRVKFGPKPWALPRPRVCIMEPKRSKRILGWYSANRWQQGAVKLDEIVLTPDSVSQGVYEAASTLSHELVHLANAVAERSDTSRQGRYHNAEFRETAEAMGLVVAQHPDHGWCETELGPELREIVKRMMETGKLSSHPFRYQRRRTTPAGRSLVKVTSPCGVFAYVTRGNADYLMLKCSCCGEFLRPVDDELAP